MLWLAHVGLSVPQCPGLRHRLLALSIAYPHGGAYRYLLCSLVLSAMGVNLEAKAYLMIWRNWWTSRSSFSRSIIGPPSRRSALLSCGDHISTFRSPPLFTMGHHPAASATATAVATKLSAMSACKSGLFHWNGKQTPCVRSELECVTCNCIGEHS